MTEKIKDAILMAVATAAIGVCAKFAYLPSRVDALEKAFNSMDKKLDIIISRIN